MDGTACQSASAGLAGKKAQQPRALALPKDASSGPSTHVCGSQLNISSARGLVPSTGFCGHLHACDKQAHK